MDTAFDGAAVSRAGLFKLGAAAAALAVSLTPAGEALVREVELIPASDFAAPWYLRFDTYRHRVGEFFQIEREGMEPLVVSLESVNPLNRAGDGFSLLFRGGTGAQLESRMHEIVHRSLGAFSLFLGPIGRGINGQGFQAIINRSG